MTQFCEFSELLGKTLKAVDKVGDDVLRFTCEDGTVYESFHVQDCCETVVIESITGDLSDLVGTPILLAEEATSEDAPEGVVISGYNHDDSQTWTLLT